jgi:hypothetical protein
MRIWGGKSNGFRLKIAALIQIFCLYFSSTLALEIQPPSEIDFVIHRLI